MEVKFFKVFFSKHKECQWLNELGESGHLLTKINDSRYHFEKSDEHKYKYSVEHLDFSPQSNDAQIYFKSRLNSGVKPLVSDNNWVYFVSENEGIELDNKVFKKNALYHFWRFIYTFFFAQCGSFLVGYHIFSIKLLERLGQAGDGRISSYLSLSRSTSILYALLNLFKRIGNYMIDVLNGYFKIWTHFFGESDPIAVISIVIPITIVLFLIAAFHFNEFLLYKKLSKGIQNNQQEDINENAE